MCSMQCAAWGTSPDWEVGLDMLLNENRETYTRLEHRWYQGQIQREGGMGAEMKNGSRNDDEETAVY